ncbi:MAG: peptidylprolyl isomerase [Acidobacteria bacterium]|jgi:cyclophilin family peptidyl-prolyl cis-trans isomerase|nr:peptidylprolyl isomerase [Acidobacteriota bacterium]
MSTGTVRLAGLIVLALAATSAAEAQARRAPAAPPAKKPAFYTTSLTPDAMRGKQAVIATDRGDIVLQLLGDKAPNHVGHFIETAQKGGYDGTAFHRAVKFGVLQGGDPHSKDPAQKARYGTGGLNLLRAEPNDEKHTRGAVSAVLVPGNPDSAGTQFFICITDQPTLDGRFTVFARVVEGIEIAQAISAEPTDDSGLLTGRIVVAGVTIRDTPPEPFAADADADLAKYKVTLQTSKGDIDLELWPDRAPGHVRQFLTLAAAGVFDGTSVHRVVPGFVIQAGSLDTRATPLRSRQQALVRNQPPEFSETKHERGIVSMARGDAPDSATTSFFICLGPAPSLDGKYTVFARVAGGDAVIDAIAAVARNGEAPVERIDLVAVRITPAP